MSRFLRNLIYRHQPGGVDLNARLIVQPRPRSRFESGLSEGPSPGQHDPDSEAMQGFASKPSSPDSQIPPHRRTEADSNTAVADVSTEHVNEHINALTHAVERPAPEAPIFSPRYESRPQNPDRTVTAQNEEQSSPVTERSDGDSLTASDVLNLRFQTVLHRYNNQQPQPADSASTASSRQGTDLSSAATVTSDSAISSAGEPPYMPGQFGSIEQGDSVKKLSTVNRPERQDAFHNGVLMTPDWLTEMQHDLNNRWREMKSGTESEQVVNVTIGRVEVRAIHKDSVKQTETRDKPVGIMSLGDYLQQRDRVKS